ncbi:DNA-binding transcriptional LysR family regulator [Caulobacter rhizosphaerae]|uniref:DNA-binding transcriptional LysR family regulator n=1 Tax=Caulobacter rhizosphaerae TaxID=2010972 RepID=A0ABU1MWX1_9CAUL|nr:LysR family transcriptional regulator [Caulobacter rhizosphaerae]MDR6530221.1 DNA-binding transcriptional LysR family regulator [Caulobacter rhizosphaerae]
MTEIGLSELRAFVEVARRQSFRRAADLRGMSRSSLSHAMRALEQRLGVRLLNRTTRSVALTQAGEQLLKRLPAVLGELDDLLDTVSHGEDEVVGVLRINAEEAGARWLLRNVVPAFLERHPRVALDIETEGRFVDIVAEGFDAGVRLADAVPQDMIAVPFGGDVRFLAVAAPSYLAAHGVPKTPHDLQGHRCIRQRLPSGKRYRWEFAKGSEELAIEVPGALSLNNSALMADAAIGGLGIAFIPQAVAAPALADGKLVPLLEDWLPAYPGLCLYHASRRLVPPALKAFIAVLRQAGRGAA